MNIRPWMNAGMQIGRQYAWMPILVFVIHLIGNSGFDLYRRFPPFDIPMHVMGGTAIAYFFAGMLDTMVREGLLNQPESWVRALFLFSLTCVATVFWEFGEWTSDHLFGSMCQLGLDDTLFDMVCGLLGGGGYIVAQGGRTRVHAADIPPALKEEG